MPVALSHFLNIPWMYKKFIRQITHHFSYISDQLVSLGRIKPTFTERQSCGEEQHLSLIFFSSIETAISSFKGKTGGYDNDFFPVDLKWKNVPLNWEVLPCSVYFHKLTYTHFTTPTREGERKVQCSARMQKSLMNEWIKLKRRCAMRCGGDVLAKSHTKIVEVIFSPLVLPVRGSILLRRVQSGGAWWIASIPGHS